MPLSRLLNWISSTSDDEITDRIVAGLERVKLLELGYEIVLDQENFHRAIEPDDTYYVGFESPSNAIIVFDKIVDGWYKWDFIFKPKSTIGSHTHRRGNLERWVVTKGSVTVIFGDRLQYTHKILANQEWTIPKGVLHAFKSHDEIVEAEVYIEIVKRNSRSK